MGACLMVFQDGVHYLGAEANTARMLDALIDDDSVPVTVAVFVEPGEQGPGLPVYGGPGNCSLEYDATGPDYARFLLAELLPEALAGYRYQATRRGARPPAGDGRGRPLAQARRRAAARNVTLALARLRRELVPDRMHTAIRRVGRAANRSADAVHPMHVET